MRARATLTLRIAVERWTGNGCEILEIDPQTLVEMAAEDEPVLKAPRVPISGLNIAAAFPSIEMAQSIQKAMASSNVTKSLSRVDSKLFADAVISPELRRRMAELHKLFASPGMKSLQMRQTKMVSLASPQMAAIASSKQKSPPGVRDRGSGGAWWARDLQG